jgi:cytoskeletal protein CcmA (bactofilin family)
MKGERVVIAGSGRVSGGVYESVKVAGSGVIEGDIEAHKISTAGSCRVEGSVKAEEMKTAGSCKVKGDIEADELGTSGSCTVEGGVKADVFKSSGSQRIGGKLTAKYVKISGSCKVGGDVEADKFVSEGSFQIGSLLSADEVDILLGGDSQVGEIEGERIEVRRKGSWMWDVDSTKLEEKLMQLESKLDKLGERFGVHIDIDAAKLAKEIEKFGQKIKIDIGGFSFGASGALEAGIIEGDEIYLEFTKADTVRGKKIVIGKGCEIETVEYSESLEVDESAVVKNRVKG